jgi:hypothetical protein
VWECRDSLGFDPDGRQIRKSIYGGPRSEVQARLTKAMRDLKEGLPAPDENQTVKKFLTRWLEDCHKPSVRR